MSRVTIKLSDLPEAYQRQARAQLNAVVAGSAPREPEQAEGETLGDQGGHPPMLVDPAGPLSVRLIRVGGRTMDDDNLAAGYKPLRDAIASAFGRSGDSEADGFRWEYAQEPGEIGTRVEITG